MDDGYLLRFSWLRIFLSVARQRFCHPVGNNSLRHLLCLSPSLPLARIWVFINLHEDKTHD